MTALSRAVIEALTREYSNSAGEPPGKAAVTAGASRAPVAEVDLRGFLARHHIDDDQVLADIIEADARMRQDAGQGVDLQRYLDAVPDLAARAVPLDTAIEYALKVLPAMGVGHEAPVEALVDRFPWLEEPIREAALLGDTIEGPPDALPEAGDDIPELPRAFGPRLASGRPRYLLREVLGAGSHGTVYLAVDRQLSEQGRPAMVAIKMLVAGSEPGSRRRLIEEASKARRIDHPNVVRILDRGAASPGETYLVFEFVAGGSLETNFRSALKPIGPREAAGLVSQIARGVQAAHAAGLVHCDLKPGNVIVTPEGVPKVADFGVAVRHGEPEADERLGVEPRRVGNLAFISPEQYRVEPGSLAPASDIYSIGGILYYLLTGTLPNGRTEAEVAQTHAPIGGRAEAPSARAIRAEVDRDLDAICRRAMAVRSQDRYGSAEAMASDLEAWLRHEPIAWTRQGPWRVARLFARRQPAMLAAIALLVVLGLVIGFAAGHHLGQRSGRAGSGPIPADGGHHPPSDR